LILYLKDSGQPGAPYPAAETLAWLPLAVYQNVQQILVAKGDLRLQVLAKFPQHSLTQDIGIKLAGFCKLNNSFGDSFID